MKSRANYTPLKPGILQLQGNDCLDFLNRMSTNDLSKLKKGDFRTTILTSEKGRIVDAIRVLVLPDSIILLTSEHSNELVLPWLAKFIITEDIGISDRSDAYSAMNLFGSPALAALGEFGITVPGLEAANNVHSLPYNDTTLTLCRDELWHEDVYTLLVPETERNFPSLYGSKGKKDNALSEIPKEALNVMMIEQGVPGFGVEMTENVNPLELNFERFVSFEKGCYIGQEIIARLDTYEKLQKKMVGFYFEDDTTPPPVPGKIFLAEQEVGATTRHGFSTSSQRNIALGFLKTGIGASPLTFVDGVTTARRTIHAVSLPFGAI